MANNCFTDRCEHEQVKAKSGGKKSSKDKSSLKTTSKPNVFMAQAVLKTAPASIGRSLPNSSKILNEVATLMAFFFRKLRHIIGFHLIEDR